MKAHGLTSSQTDGGHLFNFTDILTDLVVFIPVVLGIIFQFKRPVAARSGTWFALAWLVTDFGVHLWHKPWWSYYAMHFQIPLAILAAQGAAWVISGAWDAISAQSDRAIILNIARLSQELSLSREFSANIKGIFACILIACWCGIRLPNFVKECEGICTTELIQDKKVIRFISQYKDNANWVYVNDDNLAFFNGVLQPPELVLITYKRLITGSINKDIIFEIVKSYKPDVLLLGVDQELADRRFQRLIAEGQYVRVTWSDNAELCVSPKLHPIPAKSPAEMIKQLNL